MGLGSQRRFTERLEDVPGGTCRKSPSKEEGGPLLCTLLLLSGWGTSRGKETHNRTLRRAGTEACPPIPGLAVPELPHQRRGKNPVPPIWGFLPRATKGCSSGTRPGALTTCCEQQETSIGRKQSLKRPTLHYRKHHALGTMLTAPAGRLPVSL